MRHLVSVALSLAFLFLSAIPTLAQERSAELQQLDSFVGTWTYSHIEGTTTCNRLADSIVHCTSAWTNTAGNPIEAVFLIRYDTEAEMYKGYRFYSGGFVDSGTGWFEGDTWTFVYDNPSGNKNRMTSTVSANTWTYVWHSSVRGGPWEQTSEGSNTRVR
jgi:hypothetical protein